MKPRPTHKERTLQGFRVYLEIMETAGYLRLWMRGPLELFDLTERGFRLLLLLYGEGPVRMREAAKRMRFRRQTLDPVVRRLERHGWVHRYKVTLPPVARRPRSRTRLLRSQRRRWGIGMIALTPKGESFIARAFPSNTKVVKALMRALGWREQKLLVEICRKLRAGAILKFTSEIMMQDAWETDDEPVEVEMDGEEMDETRGELLEARKKEKEKEEAEEEAAKLRVEMAETMKGIVAKMKRDNILVEATHVDWHLPRDEEREAGHVIRMLRNCGTDRERRLLDRLCRGRTNLEVVSILMKVGG